MSVAAVSITVLPWGTTGAVSTGEVYPHRQADGTWLLATTPADATGRLARDASGIVQIDDTAISTGVQSDFLRLETAIIYGPPTATTPPAAPTNLTVTIS